MTVIVADEWLTAENAIDGNNTSTVLDKLRDENNDILLDETGDVLLPEDNSLESRPTLDLFVPDANNEWAIIAKAQDENQF